MPKMPFELLFSNTEVSTSIFPSIFSINKPTVDGEIAFVFIENKPPFLILVAIMLICVFFCA
jgi:hypothetical protein